MKNQASTGGISFLGALALIFITLKLVGVITWSWWWVLAPLWMPSAIAIVIILFIIGCAALNAIFKV